MVLSTGVPRSTSVLSVPVIGRPITVALSQTVPSAKRISWTEL